MTTTSFSDIYSGGAAAVSIPEGVYDVRVQDARPGKAESRTIFIDLEVLNGPAAGKVTQVNLYVPDATNRGAVFHYQNKTAGFRSPEFKAALDALGPDPSIDDLMLGIANFLVGRVVSAEVDIQKGGQYDGQNQLVRTKATGTPVTPAPVPTQVATPAPAPEPEPALEPVADNNTPYNTAQQEVPF